MFADELNRAVKLEIRVFLFGKAVTLVLRHEKPDRRALFLERGHDLFGFRLRHSRIVCALHYKKRLGDFIRFAQGSDLLEKFGHLRIAFIAVLYASKIPPIALRVLEEGDEVGWTDHVQGTTNSIGVIRRHRQSHESAIRTASHHDAPGVETLACADPVEQGRDVLVGIFALKAVVEFQECFSIARRSADIREDDRAAELVDEIIVPSQKSRPVL